MLIVNLERNDGSQASKTTRAKGPSTTATTGKSLSTLFWLLPFLISTYKYLYNFYILEGKSLSTFFFGYYYF